MKSAVCPALFAVFIGLVIYLAEGMAGFRAFLNLEALLLVFICLGFFLWSAYPAREILSALRCGFFGRSPGNGEEAEAAAQLLGYAAAGSVKAGVLTALFGLILVFSAMETFDPSTFFRRIALVLDGPFFGYFLASMVFTPMARRLSGQAEKP